MTYEVLKQHFSSVGQAGSQAWLYDDGRTTPYHFVCPNCKVAHTHIDHKNVNVFYANKPNLNIEELKDLGGAGMLYKYIKCNTCNSTYYIGIGYREPNNGRDVYLLRTIIEVKALT